MIDVQGGVDQLVRLAKNLKAMDNKELQREFAKAGNRVTKPIKDSVHRAAETLPSRGGLAKRAANSKLATRVRTGQKVAGIRVVSVDKKLSMWHLNQGQVRHRKGGDIGAGKVQHISPGFADRAAEAVLPEARREYLAGMDEITRKIGRGV